MTYNHTQRVRILYKTILKLHKGLPEELQILGTNYIRDEFKRHKKVNTMEADIFVNEWTVIFDFFVWKLCNSISFLEICFEFSKAITRTTNQIWRKVGNSNKGRSYKAHEGWANCTTLWTNERNQTWWINYLLHYTF